MHLIPENISISTMTLTFCMGILINIDNIYNYLNLNEDDVIMMKTGKGVKYIPKYMNDFKSITKNGERNFFNQMTIIMKVIDERFMTIKLFRNGSVQITGCKSLIDLNIIINKLIRKLNDTIIIEKIMENDEKELINIRFIENIESLNISNFKIDLINCNFGINYEINRETLYTLLIAKNILCRISSIHACVNIKYEILHTDDKPKLVSIFVFQTGNIIITGAKQADHVRIAYKFIVNFLNMNKSKIIKKNISKYLLEPEFNQVLC
jgi:TATA-box binding protein (TBP) (component of TFIID and TFIIIB)